MTFLPPSMVRRAVYAVALSASVGAATAPASAASISTPFQVTATVINACIISATNLAFGNYDPTAVANTTATSAVTVTCTKGAGISVGLGVGANASSKQRQMVDTTSGDTALQYNLYQPASAMVGAACAFTAAWGDGTSATNGTVLAVGAAPSISSRTYNVCGSIPAAQNVAANTTYADTVAATINF